MSLRDIVSLAVDTADAITGGEQGVQSWVTYERYVQSTDGYGGGTYASPVRLRAVVDWKQRQLRTMAGVLSVSRASVMFLNRAALKAATGGQGISDEDRITLPDGTTGPILDMAGFIDPKTGQPFTNEVFIG